MDDWTKAEALQAEVGLEDGRDPKFYGPYLARRNAGRRDQITKGISQWFGAFDGYRIVAQLGMFHDDSIARYQYVETRATHRRRGICSALLRWAVRRMLTLSLWLRPTPMLDVCTVKWDLPTLKRSMA
ncbi:GNAT family N-acetyltransferase [Octadecabacter arcticus]|uniref:GNAT family N-acetyltransferase n=1 Tax=Octadecabacter arcticus TaxID=53946 RepID=UPI00031AA25F|nr:GNAT family N-acetyltransferase [Octadecabacter arcticus]